MTHGPADPPERSLVILGGGITGLAAAWLAVKNRRDVTVLESAGSFGGLLATFPIGDTRLECFYHHVFTHDRELQWLLSELGLSGALTFHDGTMGLFSGGKLSDLNSPRDFMRLNSLGFAEKWRFLLTTLYLGAGADWRRAENVPALAWLARHSGPAVADSVWRPLLEMRFGSRADRVPLSWVVGRLRQRMRSRRSVRERLGYIEGSFHRLLEALKASLVAAGARLVSAAPVVSLDVRDGRLVGVRTPKGDFAGGQFLSTLPTTRLADLVRPHAVAYADALGRVPYLGVVCTVLELERPASRVYWTNVADAGFPFGGAIEHTNLVGTAMYGGRHVLYLSRYFSPDDEWARLPETECGERMENALGRLAGGEPPRVLARHVFRSPAAAVACGTDFSLAIPDCRSPVEGLYMTGMCHMYPDERSCNNSVRVAAEACRVMGMDVSFVPRGLSLAGRIGMGERVPAVI